MAGTLVKADRGGAGSESMSGGSITLLTHADLLQVGAKISNRDTAMTLLITRTANCRKTSCAHGLVLLLLDEAVECIQAFLRLTNCLELCSRLICFSMFKQRGVTLKLTCDCICPVG